MIGQVNQFVNCAIRRYLVYNMNEEKAEITKIGNCILSVDRKSNIHIECAEPIKNMVIDKSDLDMVQGVTDVVEKNVDVIKKK